MAKKRRSNQLAFAGIGRRGRAKVARVVRKKRKDQGLAHDIVDAVLKGTRDWRCIAAHSLAEIFPLIEGANFDALVADIKTNGLREKIVLYEEKILDGRNRYRACLQASVKPEFKEYRGKDPLAFVISLNLKRRHLDESQRAMVGAKIAVWKVGDNQHTVGSANLPTQTQAAQMLNVGDRSVRSARTVLDKGTDELKHAVEQGHLPVSAAAQATKLSPKQQQQIAQEAAAGNAKAARTIITKSIRKAKHEKIEQRASKVEAPRGPFTLIYADPPWRWDHFGEEGKVNESGLGRTPDQHYPTLSIDEIKTFRVAGKTIAEIAYEDAALFMWCTSANIKAALDVVEAWGFTYKAHAVWDKQVQSMGLVFRNQHEVLLYATRGRMPGPQYQPSSVFSYRRTEHSRKPPEVRQAIEKMFPDVTEKHRLEIFARGGVDGWSAYGFEAFDQAAE